MKDFAAYDMPTHEPSSLALNRLSVYLRALRRLEDRGVQQIASRELADHFEFSAAQIRKDLAIFGELGIRGVGYDVAALARQLEEILGLDRLHPAAIVGVGNIGTALARFPGLNRGAFRIVALFDVDPQRIGDAVGELTIRDSAELGKTVRELGVEIGILAVPAEAAAENHRALVDAGVRAILNFAPVQLPEIEGVRVKSVDLTIFLEELAHHLG